MASSPITSWQKHGETMKTVRDFIFLVSKITADDDCSREIKRHLPLRRKAMTNLDSILNSRDITLPTKSTCCQGCGFSSSHVRMWELDCKEGWAPKKLMLSNCDAGEDSWESLGLQRPNQSILKEINPEYSLQGLLLKLKLHILVTWCEELTH